MATADPIVERESLRRKLAGLEAVVLFLGPLAETEAPTRSGSGAHHRHVGQRPDGGVLMTQREDLRGQQFGRLVVDGGPRLRGNQTEWFCKCVCGEWGWFGARHMKAGRTTSCGCVMREVNSRLMSERFTVHGHSSRSQLTPTYRSWHAMRQRCRDPQVRNYRYYGGRGIAVCERWSNSFQNFLADMGERPMGSSIDRINNDGNYEPSNCRWATASEQNRNRRTPQRRKP